MVIKAVRVHAFGGPEVMRVEDIELAPPGRGQVLVRNHAIGVNYIDTYFRSGHYQPPSMPFVLGHEASGEVIGVGEDVESVGVGDRVAYVASLGCYAEMRVVPADRLIKLPDAVAYDTAAAMMLKGMTAQYLIRQIFPVAKGHTILVHAAAGGVGLILCQWAHALGATVIGTVGTPEKAELAKKAGADHVILYRDVDFAARVKDITAGGGCDAVYDGVGQATFPASLDCLKRRGVFVSFGSASGPIEPFSIGLLQQKGSLLATRPTLNDFTTTAAELQATAQDLMQVVADGTVEIAIHARSPLDQAAAVHRLLEGRATTGSTVLTC